MATMNAEEKLANMQKAIKEGGSVLYKGRVISNKADLPSKSELAVTPAEQDAALLDLDARRKVLDDEEARIRSSRVPKAVAPPPKPEDAAKKLRSEI